MHYQIIQFIALFLLMLVTGIFWGPLFSLHRTLYVFNKVEFILIVKTIANNLAVPMRIMMPGCILFMFLSIWLYPVKDSIAFYLNIIAFILIIVSLIITLSVELPIVNRIVQWTENSIPSNWESIRDKWIKFHIVRTTTALLSFGCFISSIIFF